MRNVRFSSIQSYKALASFSLIFLFQGQSLLVAVAWLSRIHQYLVQVVDVLVQKSVLVLEDYAAEDGAYWALKAI